MLAWKGYSGRTYNSAEVTTGDLWEGRLVIGTEGG